MLGKKLLQYTTPFHRIFITIEKEDGDIIVLPAIHSATIFLEKGDNILLDNMDDLDALVFLDYALLDPKNGEKRFIEDFLNFKNLVKKHLLQKETNNTLTFIVEGRILYGKNCNIICKITN